MTRLPRASGRSVVRALQRDGFVLSHILGSHHYLRRPDGGGLVVVPVHSNHDLPDGTMRSILRQSGLTAARLSDLLHGGCKEGRDA